VPDEGLGVAAISLQQAKAPVAGDVGDLDQVGAALHCGGHKTGAQAVAKIASAMAPLAAGVVASPRLS
jgi:hypothetical protein